MKKRMNNLNKLRKMAKPFEEWEEICKSANEKVKLILEENRKWRIKHQRFIPPHLQ